MRGYRHQEDARVYFARGLKSGLWKIGITYRPAARLRLLAAKMREPVEIVAVIVGTRADETRICETFAPLCVKGREWFSDDGRIAAYVAALPAECRGSLVQTFGTRVEKTADQLAAEAAKQASRDAWYEARHHHPRGFRADCRACVNARESARKKAAALVVVRAEYPHRIGRKAKPVPAFASDSRIFYRRSAS